MITGKKIYLDSLNKNDLKNLRIWRNNQNYRKFFREFREISEKDQLDWFNEIVKKNDHTIMFAIRNSKKKLIGCCGLVYINWKDKNADLSLYIGENNVYIDNKGYAIESVKLLLKYGFHELNLNRIWTEIYEFDQKKIKLYSQLGFKLDGKLRQNYWYDGRWWNSLIYSKLSKEFK